jgi:twitching motility protein PilT
MPGVAQMTMNLALPMLQDDDEEIRLTALAVVEKHPSEALITHVIQLAQSGGGRVVNAAFTALKRLLPSAQADHTPEILPLLADGDANVRKGAIAILAQTAPEVLAQRFVEHFSGALIWVRDRMLDTLIKHIPEFVPAILTLANDQDAPPAARKAARELSLGVADPRAVPVWLDLVEDPDWWIRQSAMECLGKHGQGREDVFRRIVASLKDPQLSLSAVSALGQLGDARGAGPLFETFKASQMRPEDQSEILDALAKLGEREPRVGPILAKVSTLPEVAIPVREKARLLVGKLQGEEAREALPAVAAVVKTIDLSQTPEPTLVDLLADTVASGASDFHIATGFVPHRRIHGKLEPLPVPPVDRARSEQLIKAVLNEEQWHRLEERRHIDLCLPIEGLGRFRANFFSQRQGFDASFRVIPATIPKIEQIGLPESAWEVCRYSQGLVLVTGPAGCGKSTTLAALVNLVNENLAGHIITVEDPIEFVHPSKECLVTQREVPKHTASFARALKAALREDPDVIMVGEMRDLETISLAVSASETGHLVFATLNTTTATGTIDRVINAFPAGQQAQIRSMLADSLKAVFSQALLPRASGGDRIAVFEILRGTVGVASMIREAKTFQLPSAMQTGQPHGMMTMDQALMKLVEEGKIDAEVAMDRAIKKDPFEKLLAEDREVVQ